MYLFSAGWTQGTRGRNIFAANNCAGICIAPGNALAHIALVETFGISKKLMEGVSRGGGRQLGVLASY